MTSWCSGDSQTPMTVNLGSQQLFTMLFNDRNGSQNLTLFSWF